MARKASPIDPTKIFVAGDGFVGAMDDGREVIIPVGTRLRGDNPIVERFRRYFAEDGTAYVPPEPPEIDASDPGSPVRPPLTVDSPGALRVRTDYRGMIGTGHGKALFEFAAGQLVQAHWPTVALIKRTDKALFAKLFEPAK